MSKLVVIACVCKMLIKLSFTLLFLVSASPRASRHVRSITKTKRLSGSEPIMVPPNIEPEIPEHCRNHSFCEDVPNYPYEYIDYLLENNETERNALYLLTDGFGGAAGCKKDNDPRNVEICKSEMKYVQAKAAQNSSGRWYFLVGKQGFCEELCKSEQANAPCSKTIRVPTSYEASCRQKRINIPVAALINGTIVHVHPFLYDGCWCQVERPDSIQN